MSVSYCMSLVLDIARLPEAQWAERIAAIPEGCEHDDCGAPRCCRERAAEFLRMQWRIQRRLDTKGVRRG